MILALYGSILADASKSTHSPMKNFFGFCATTILTSLSNVFGVTSIALNPIRDTFVSSTNPSSNYGSAGALGVSAAGLAKGEFQILMMFDLSLAKAQFDANFGAGFWFVDSINLQLTAANPNNPLFNTSSAGSIGVRWLFDDSWIEGVGTPAAPSANGANFSFLAGMLTSTSEALASYSYDGATSGVVSIPLSLGNGLLSDIEAGGNTTLNLHAKDTQVSGLFNSRNNSTVANRPSLTIVAQAIPEPCTGMILACPTLFFITRRCRQ